MRATWVAMLMLVAAQAAVATEPADKPPEAAPEAVAAEPEEFKVPPGFRKKTRGKYVVYCRKEHVMGTRVDSEKCYDEQGLREMERARVENQEKVDQMRRICGSMAACGGGG